MCLVFIDSPCRTRSILQKEFKNQLGEHYKTNSQNTFLKITLPMITITNKTLDNIKKQAGKAACDETGQEPMRRESRWRKPINGLPCILRPSHWYNLKTFEIISETVN